MRVCGIAAYRIQQGTPQSKDNNIADDDNDKCWYLKVVGGKFVDVVRCCGDNAPREERCGGGDERMW